MPEAFEVGIRQNFLGLSRLFTPRLPNVKFLAVRAKIATSISDSKPLNGCAANRAGSAASMSHTEVIMRCAQLSIGTNVCIYASSLAAYSRLQYIDDRPVEALCLLC